MSLTPSSMLPLGSPAPLFTLKDVMNQSEFTLKPDAHIPATVIMFICNHCPYVKHVSMELTRLAQDYQSKNIRFIGINANDYQNYPADSPENMIITAQEKGYPFPYLIDESQDVAKAYNAACTPDFFVFDNQLKLVYRGQLDDSRPGNDVPLSGHSIRHALDCVLDNKPNNEVQKPSIGCNIKWRSGD